MLDPVQPLEYETGLLTQPCVSIDLEVRREKSMHHVYD